MTLDTGGGPRPPRTDYSTASAGGFPRLVNNMPAVLAYGSAAFYDENGEAYTLNCSQMVRPDRTLIDNPLNSCSMSVTFRDGMQAYASDIRPAVTVTTMTDTSIEMRVASIPGVVLRSNGDAGTRTITLTNVIFRASASAAHYTLPSNAYRP